MAEYKADNITEIKAADDGVSVRIEFAGATKSLTLIMDWRLASELIDKLAVVNNQIRHVLSAPDTRARRLRTGCHRAGVVLAALMIVPVLWGLWAWITGALDAGSWGTIGAFLLAAPVVYAVVWAAGWVAAAFIGNRQQYPT
jgi:hypothetical protein